MHDSADFLPMSERRQLPQVPQRQRRDMPQPPLSSLGPNRLGPLPQQHPGHTSYRPGPPRPSAAAHQQHSHQQQQHMSRRMPPHPRGGDDMDAMDPDMAGDEDMDPDQDEYFMERSARRPVSAL
jgi:hypothetical protein